MASTEGIEGRTVPSAYVQLFALRRTHIEVCTYCVGSVPAFDVKRGEPRSHRMLRLQSLPYLSNVVGPGLLACGSALD